MAKDETNVSMVKSMEDMQKAYDIRRQEFVVEGEECEEIKFDRNDFCAAHLYPIRKANLSPQSGCGSSRGVRAEPSFGNAWRS
ncbi:MAG: hypothetical protein QNK92_15810 [Amylibacter sp.]